MICSDATEGSNPSSVEYWPSEGRCSSQITICSVLSQLSYSDCLLLILRSICSVLSLLSYSNWLLILHTICSVLSQLSYSDWLLLYYLAQCMDKGNFTKLLHKMGDSLSRQVNITCRTGSIFRNNKSHFFQWLLKVTIHHFRKIGGCLDDH